MPPEVGDGLPLTGRGAAEVICHRGGEAVTVGRFLAEAASLAALLPEGDGPAVNACADRYLALLGFAAALLRGHPTLLGAGRGGTSAFWRMAAERHPEAYALAD